MKKDPRLNDEGPLILVIVRSRFYQANQRSYGHMTKRHDRA